MGGTGNVPPSWFIDFGDVAITNRYGVETIQIDVQGRTCGNGMIQSDHDRLHLSTTYDSIDSLLWGRGACTDYPATIVQDCRSNVTVAEIDNFQRGCPELCGATDCESIGAYCHCLLAQCLCVPGRYGPMCEYDICSKCSDSGGCSSKFLGSTLHVSYQACLCEDESRGEYCQGGQDFFAYSDHDRPTPVELNISQPPSNGPTETKPIQFGASASYTSSSQILLLLILPTLLIFDSL
jgi:hypothetical protein